MGWMRSNSLSANNITAGRILSADDGGTQMQEAKEFLREILVEPTLATECYTEANNRGISQRTLNRAKKELGVIVEREGTKGKKGGGKWVWRSPDED